jgi:hypothetical protein
VDTPAATKKPFHIEVDGTKYDTVERQLNGSQIKALAGRPPGNRLYRLEGDHQRVEIGDEEIVQLQDRERFVTHPRVGKAS